MSDEPELRIVKQMPDIGHAARVKVVNTYNFITFQQKTVAQMGTDETGSTCN